MSPSAATSPTIQAARTNQAAGRAEAKPLPIQGDLDFALRLLFALVLAMAIGAEREFHGHPAGLRTMALVSVGSCLFTALGAEAFAKTVDPTRIAGQVVTGIGFLGAGAIIREGTDVRGLTTAASIWVVAAIGMAAGFGLYLIATFTTLLVLVALVAIRPIERRLFTRGHKPDDPEASRGH